VTLIDASAWADVPARDAARERAVAAMGITVQLRCGCGGASPASDFEVTALNRRRRAPLRDQPLRYAWCAAVDARRPDHARDQIARASQRGAVGIDVFTAGADELALDAVVLEASRRGIPIRVADPAVLAGLVKVHRRAEFVLSRPTDSPFTADELAPFVNALNVHLDLASCGAVRGAIDDALARFGFARLLWGTGDRMDVALAQLRALDVIAPGDEALDAIRWRNAERLYKRLGKQ
jgi:hypothetical protein